MVLYLIKKLPEIRFLSNALFSRSKKYKMLTITRMMCQSKRRPTLSYYGDLKKKKKRIVLKCITQPQIKVPNVDNQMHDVPEKTISEITTLKDIKDKFISDA